MQFNNKAILQYCSNVVKLPLTSLSAILGSEEQMLRHLCVMQEANAETSFDFSFCITQTKQVWYALLSRSSALDVGN